MMEEVPAALGACDAAVVCTSSRRFVVTRGSITDRGGRRLVVVDLGLPRNVDPAVVGVEGVSLVHLDELAVAGIEQADQVAMAEEIVAGQFGRFRRWERGRRVGSLIARLKRAADDVEPEVRRRRTRLLHGPIIALKDGVAA